MNYHIPPPYQSSPAGLGSVPPAHCGYSSFPSQCASDQKPDTEADFFAKDAPRGQSNWVTIFGFSSETSPEHVAQWVQRQTGYSAKAWRKGEANSVHINLGSKAGVEVCIAHCHHQMLGSMRIHCEASMPSDVLNPERMDDCNRDQMPRLIDAQSSTRVLMNREEVDKMECMVPSNMPKITVLQNDTWSRMRDFLDLAIS